ncbi:MAG TPA: DUF2269 family protein [Actinomycetota bacterium]
MWSWFTFFLIGHILAAIVAFGPAFSFALIAAQGRKEPQHGAFAAELIHALSARVVIPVAFVVGVFGIGLIFTAHVDLWHSEWLLIALALYIAALTFSIAVQLPRGGRFAEMLSAMPPGPPVPGARPPTEIVAEAKKLQFGGIYLTLSVAAIVVMMVWKPGAAFN